ncbi:glycoside hydrolase family 16 protein [Paenibacillus sp. 598K]|uniref:glycoside hydrolase family 16 protein n=1 Tax=Paenibacillus sp. 598K TaxID=1117987 RepID=UPI001625B3FF|nr:glycoside hydrolase family 16 protein [Paenibacillus sp. 598K]
MTTRIWEQDFTRADADLSQWNIREGNDLLDREGRPIHPGWGNGELQYYTGRPGNLYLDAVGLHLCARREETRTEDGRLFAYTSARLDTRDHMSYCYGKLVVRTRLPIGQGLWPAIWLLPQDEAYGPWPASGEIDVMEARGRLPRQVSGTLHYGRDFEHKMTDEHACELTDGDIGRFRDYGLEWEPEAVRWLVDGRCYAEQRLLPEEMPFDQRFYLVLNLAVGGWYDQVEVDEAALPGTMTVSGIWLYSSPYSSTNEPYSDIFTS